MLDPELRREVDALWDKFWSGGLANPLMAIDQMNYLIFLKRLETIDDLNKKRAKAKDQKFSSLFEKAEKNRFSHWKHLGAEDMFSHVQQQVFPWMKEIAPNYHAFTSFMKDATFLIPKPSLLVEAVSVIDRLEISDQNIDTQGDIYEHMLSKLGVAGQIGQFRTPRHLIRAIVEMVDPKIGETVLDPACGTAGFLVAAYQHMIAQGTSDEFLSFDEQGAPHGLVGDLLTKKQWATLNSGVLQGYDFDPSMVRIAAMNMVLHGIEQPLVAYADSLGKAFDHSARANMVLANPPFAGSVETSDIAEEFKVKTSKTELLFLELIESLLLPGGRAAVIVPDGVLFANKKAYTSVRSNLVDNNRLDAVVSLPNGAFKPYTNVKASVLFFTRGGTTKGNVWMFEVNADGYTLDDRREPTAENDLVQLVQDWAERKESAKGFLVPAEDIRANKYNLSLSPYKETVTVLVEDSDPAELLEHAEGLASEILAEVTALRKIVES